MRRLLLALPILLATAPSASAAVEARATIDLAGGSWATPGTPRIINAFATADTAVEVTLAQGAGNAVRHVRLVAPPGEGLHVGAYPVAVDPDARAAGQAGISVRTESSAADACAGAVGSFTITDLRIAGGRLGRLRATFELSCPPAAGVLSGELRWRETSDEQAKLLAAPGVSEYAGAALPDGAVVVDRWKARTVRRRLVETFIGAVLRAADGTSRTIPAKAVVTDAGGGLVVGVKDVRGHGMDLVAYAYPSLVKRAVPRGINTRRDEWYARTDGSSWQYLRRTGPRTVEVRLRLPSGRDVRLARGDVVAGGVGGGVTAWATCVASADCSLHVRNLRTGRSRAFRPAPGTSFYGISVGADGATYAVVGPSTRCDVARFVRVSPAGRLANVGSAGGDVSMADVARVGVVDRLVYSTARCDHGRAAEVDLMGWSLDPDPMPPLVETLPPA